MRRKLKRQAEELAAQISQAHEQIRKYIEQKKISQAMELMEDCQSGAISLGTLIEKTEGGDHPTVKLLEEYCELIYSLHEKLGSGGEGNANKIFKILQRKWFRISSSLKNDVKARIEVVFLPYKASMWDSLESVWQAADADPDCAAYVVPIPYYSKTPDGKLGEMHYEAAEYPENVPILLYKDFDFESRCPDIVFIHNPYDYANHVTSIPPFYYSENLKKYTDCLVYIPYYATSGGMNEAQALCPAYLCADYIVTQSESYRDYFDKNIPDKKFLPFGSPKFDSTIHICQNPPRPPAEWEERLYGRKVYFYNTSLGGMLADTEAFFKKVKYVFDTFRGRQDACLLWRPHPLLESTFRSLRPSYLSAYQALKKEFVEDGGGILDETPSMEHSIALSDVYIGDAGTSVTSLFGVAGKPLFILNNYIHSLPGEDDQCAERRDLQFHEWGDDRYQVTNNNQLWYSEKNDYHYRFYLDLGTGYSGSRYYLRAMEIKGKIYVLPCSAQNLLIIENKKIRKIEFEKLSMQPGAFFSCWHDEEYGYLYLYPNQYPCLVRFHLETEKVEYINGVRDFYARYINGKWEMGGIGLYENELIFASPEDDQFLFVDRASLQTKIRRSGAKGSAGTQGIAVYGEELWLMPVKGMNLIRWNPKTGKTREYDEVPRHFKSLRWPSGEECDEHPFGGIAFYGGKTIVVAPNGGNMYLSLDTETGRMEEWRLPFGSACRSRNGYHLASGMGGLVITLDQVGKADCRIWYAPERKLYEINLITREYREVEIDFAYEDLLEHEPGFMEESEWLQYCLNENAFNSLKSLLDGNVTGNPFDRERQLRAFSKINANTEGTCGEKVYAFVKDKML